jgi:hypothetical protein
MGIAFAGLRCLAPSIGSVSLFRHGKACDLSWSGGVIRFWVSIVERAASADVLKVSFNEAKGIGEARVTVEPIHKLLGQIAFGGIGISIAAS